MAKKKSNITKEIFNVEIETTTKITMESRGSDERHDIVIVAHNDTTVYMKEGLDTGKLADVIRESVELKLTDLSVIAAIIESTKEELSGEELRDRCLAEIDTLDGVFGLIED